MGANSLQNLLDGLAGHGDRTALLAFRAQGLQRWSYRRLGLESRRFAAWLLGEGLERGQRVGIMAPPGPEWVTAFLGAIRAGATAVPLDTQLAPETLGRVVDDAAASFHLAGPDQAQALSQASRGRVLALGSEAWERIGSQADAERARLPDLQPGDYAALFYTSGTSGPPKGVPLTHSNLAFEIEALQAAGLVGSEDSILLPLPLHHVYPLIMGLLAPLSWGLTVILPASLTGHELTRAMSRGRPTVLVGVPRLYQVLRRSLEERLQSLPAPAAAGFRAAMAASRRLRSTTGLSAGRVLLRPLQQRLGGAVRLAASGGAPLEAGLAWWLEGLGWKVVVGYGLTETSPLVSLKSPDDLRLDSVGRAVEGVELRVSRAGLEGADPEEGEVQVRGPNVFGGYWNLPEKTREAFTEDGWFRTGDLGRRDRKGRLYITGRLSSRIVTAAGENLNPEEVESAYEEHPWIKEAALVATGGGLALLAAPASGAGLPAGADQEEALRQAVSERGAGLPSHQRVGEVRLTRRALPRTRLGKLRRHLLAGRLEEARKAGARKQKPLDPEDMADEDRRLLEDQAARDAWEWLAERFADRPLTPDSNPELDLDIDSLEWVGLSLELERRTGVRLSEEEIARVETVRDLLRLAAGGGSGRRGPSLQDALERPRDALSPEQRVWLDHRPAGREKQLLALLWLDRLLVGLLARVRVFGLERLQAGEPLVLCPNHASFLDPFLLAAVLGRQRLARTRWVGLADFLRLTPLHRHISRVAGALPLNPRTSPVSGLALAAAALDQGQSLVWFPEGRRSPHGRVQEFLPGVGELLAARDIRAVPVRITGSFQILPAGRLLPRPGGATVSFGGPLTADELERMAGAGRDEALDRPRRIARGLRRAVESLGAQ